MAYQSTPSDEQARGGMGESTLPTPTLQRSLEIAQNPALAQHPLSPCRDVLSAALLLSMTPPSRSKAATPVLLYRRPCPGSLEPLTGGPSVPPSPPCPLPIPQEGSWLPFLSGSLRAFASCKVLSAPIGPALAAVLRH